jgi:hypothetical protein
VKVGPVISRRSVMQAAGLSAASLAAACTGSDETDPKATRSTSPATQPTQDPDVVLLISAIADEESLRNYCEAAAAHHRQLKQIVTPVLKVQREHVRRLRATLTNDQPRRSGSVAPVPAKPRQAVTTLRQLVSSAEEARLSDCLDAESGLLARLFASASAAHALTVERVRKA